jgi:hypothetical protein
MSNLTRDVLVKTIVANEMQHYDNGSDYTKKLKSVYHKWEHESSIVLCEKFNQINNTNINVDILEP